jgi:hypothetical protein
VTHIKGLLGANPYLSQKQICHILGIDHHMVKQVVTADMGLRKLNFKWSPDRDGSRTALTAEGTTYRKHHERND